MSIQTPDRSVSATQSSTYRVTDSRQRWLNSAMPKASISRLECRPSSRSTSISTGRPWLSQPPLRGTRWPCMVRNRG